MADKNERIETTITEEFRWLHRHPELSHEEFETTKRVRTALLAAHVRILALPLATGLIAEVGEGDPVIAIRCDIDALPVEEQTNLPYRSEAFGKMHACGHDFHTAAVLGAALLLKEREKERARARRGRVRIVFQPAEEAPGGAKDVLKTGALDGVSAIFGIHAAPALEVGTVGIRAGAVTASVDRFQFRFCGKGTHAAHPNHGIDPIPIAAAFVQAVQTVVSRSLDPFSAGLVSVTHVEAGNTWNVLPETAFVEGTTRSLSAADRTRIRERVCAIAEGAAAAGGARLESDWYAGPPATDNDPAWTLLASKVAEAEGLAVLPAEVALIGEDFAFYQEYIPGAFLLVGTGLSAPLHNPKFEASPTALFPTAHYLAALADAARSAPIKKAGQSK